MTTIQAIHYDREPPPDYGVLGNDGGPHRRVRSDDAPTDPLMVGTPESMFGTPWTQPIVEWSGPLFHFSSGASLDLDIATATPQR